MDGKTTTYYVSPKIVTWDSLIVSGFPFAVGNMDGSFGLLRVYKTLEEFFANCPDEKPVTVVAMKIEPQPEPIANSDGAWWYDGEPYMSNDAMESHLFHNVYGDRLGNSTVFDECYPVLIDGDWYWQE